MPQFHIDEDLVALVERLAKPRPFESFNSALRRVIQGASGPAKSKPGIESLDDLLSESIAMGKAAPKKAPSPSAIGWVASVPELKSRRSLTTWKAICDALKIDTAGDSARRKLKNWVKSNRPTWTPVPDID